MRYMDRLVVTCDSELADYWKIHGNEISGLISGQLPDFFGPLVHIIRGNITKQNFLKESYVSNFLNHDSELDIALQIEKSFPRDLSIYSDITNWARRHYNFAAGLLGTANEFNPQDWNDPDRVRALCGSKGCGKTTLLLHTLARLEEMLKEKVEIIYINLANIGFDSEDLTVRKKPSLENYVKYINTQLITRLDMKVLAIVDNHGEISDSDMISERFKDYWKVRGIYPQLKDTARDLRRKKLLRERESIRLHQHKYGFEFDNYVRYSVDYLRTTFGIKLVIMLDDIDRLKNVEDARNIINYAASLARKIGNTPIVVSSREETLALLADINDQDIIKVPIIPPTFDEILRKRREVFNNNLKINESELSRHNISQSDVLSFVNYIIFSILDKENLFHFLSFHYDLDILLDMVQCIISSPFIDYQFAMEYKKTGKYLPWHILLDTLQRYRYINFYGENSYVLNVYDNGRDPTTKNCLIRIRILQVIRKLIETVNQPIKVGPIYAYMNQLGYERPEVIAALEAFAKQRLIVTGRKYNTFTNDLSEVIPLRSIIYYLEYLIYSYRYLQNILPVTHIPFNIPLKFINQRTPLRGSDLRDMDDYIIKFIKFISECEKEEEKGVIDNVLFDEITRNKSLTRSLNEAFRIERERIRSY